MARQRGDNTNPDDPNYDPYAARQAMLNGFLPGDQIGDPLTPTGSVSPGSGPTDPTAPGATPTSTAPGATTMDEPNRPPPGDQTDPTNPPPAPPTPPPTPPPTAPQQNQAPASNPPVWDTIAGYFKDASHGRYSPSQQDISQWGSNIDQNYLNTIRQTIYSQWAPKWLSANPDPGTTTPTTTKTPTTPDDWNKNNIDLTGIDPRLIDFFKSKGLTPTARGSGNTDIAYWNDKLSEPGADWGYLQGRIMGIGGDQGGQNTAPTAGRSDNPFSFNPSFNPIDTPFNQQMRQMLLQELGNYSTPITADSPELLPAIQANATQSQRDEQTARDQLAEQAYAESPGGAGIDSGGLNTAIAQNREVAAGQRANFAGQAVAQANMQRRQQLVQMLGQAEQYGLGDQAQQIQQQIAQIDAQLREQSLNQGFATSNNGLAFDYAQLQAQLNRDALLYGMTG